MKKKLLLMLYFLAVCTAIFTVKAAITYSQERYWRTALSGGEVRMQPLADQDVLENTVVLPDNVLSLRLQTVHADKIDIENKYLILELLDGKGTILYQGRHSFREVGYIDTSSKSDMIFEFPEPLPGGTYLLKVSTENITAKDELKIEMRSEAGSFVGEARLNGKPLRNTYLLSHIYRHGEKVSSKSVILTGILVEALLFAAILRCRNKEDHKKTAPPPVKPMKHAWKGILLILIMELIVFEYGYHTAIKESVYMPSSTSYTDGRILIPAGEKLEWTITAQENKLSAIALNMSQSYDPDFRALLQIYSEKGDIIFDKTLNIDDMINRQGNAYRQFCFPVQPSSKDKDYRITLENLNAENELNLRSSNKEGVPYTASYYLQYQTIEKLYFLIGAILIGGSILLYLGYCHSLSIASLFVFTFLPLILCSSLIIKPLSVPDEYAHYDTAYAISNELLGISDPYTDAIYKRECDLMINLHEAAEVSGSTLRWFYRHKDLAGHRSEPLILTYARDIRSDSNGFYYLPAALGITISRIIGMDMFTTFYMGRLANILTALFLCIASIHRLKNAPILPAILCLLPISLQQLGSVSPDALIIPLCFLVVACLVHCLQEERITIAETAELLSTSATLAFAKGGAYAPVSLLAILILLLRQKKDHSLQKRQFQIMLMAFLILFCFALYTWWPAITSRLFSSQSMAYDTRSGRWSYSMEYLITHPGKTIRIIEGFFFRTLPSLFMHAFGAELGVVIKLNVNTLIQVGLIAVVVLTVFLKNHSTSFSKPVRLSFVLTALLSFSAFAFALLLSWTTLGVEYINGLDIRYFLPCAPLLILAVKNDSLCVELEDERVLLLITYCLQFCGLISLCIAAWG